MAEPGRDKLIAGFLAKHGWGAAERRPLAGDASFRRYERLARNGERAVLMDAPPPQEDVRPFIKVDLLLRSAGLNAPGSMPPTKRPACCCSRISATTPIRGCSRAAMTSASSMNSRSMC